MSVAWKVMTVSSAGSHVGELWARWGQLLKVWMEALTESSLGVGDMTVEVYHPLISHCLHHPHNRMVGVEADPELVLVQEELEALDEREEQMGHRRRRGYG